MHQIMIFNEEISPNARKNAKTSAKKPTITPNAPISDENNDGIANRDEPAPISDDNYCI